MEHVASLVQSKAHRHVRAWEELLCCRDGAQAGLDLSVGKLAQEIAVSAAIQGHLQGCHRSWSLASSP